LKLPAEMLRLFKGERFCTLATSSANRPHAFLMVFTYLPRENLIILSSRGESRKVKQIEENNEVALLFYNKGKSDEPPISCTLYGTALILPNSNSTYYREIHCNHHPDKKAFIKGENISIILVNLQHAVLSDAQDNVKIWKMEDNSPIEQ